MVESTAQPIKEETKEVKEELKEETKVPPK